MMKARFSIGGLMGVVAVVGMGLLPLMRPSVAWGGGMLLITCGVLAMSIVGVVARRGIRRIRWLGFALFGWGYLFLSGCGAPGGPNSALPTSGLVTMVGVRLGIVDDPATPDFFRRRFGVLASAYAQIVHCLLALLFAAIGGLLSGFLFAPTAPEDRPGIVDETRTGRGRWLAAMVVGLVALIVAVAAATVSDGIGVAPLAGITLLLTCALHGVSILAAILRRGRARAAWLGAALFGVAYTAIIFSRPHGDPPTHLAAEPILNGLRAHIDRILPGPNGRIRQALDRSIPMRFPNGVSLEDLIDHIKRETAGPDEPALPIYVVGSGLQEAERSLDSTIQIDLEGIPLRTTLPLALDQLGLDPVIKDGLLLITSEDSEEYELSLSRESLNDPFRIVGNCLLSLVAAGFGAVAAMVVDGSRRATTGTATESDA